ncbi:EndoU domain-containing protein [uncultured Clostridium sp.]|uniref:EndoU domain-containing protein n=1 Tax=uncultured Clostridium sp. TaxID=59620 RepID=UPI0025DD6A2B|nr:EndoU domain-containing protein [uncultured Clostridium sp.]
MRKLIVDYGESTEININLKNSLNSLEKELRNTEEAIKKIESLEGGYRYSSEILNELYSQKREIEKSYDEINYFQGNFTNFIEKVKTTDEDLAKNFKGRVESYCKENKIEITSDFDVFLDKVQAVLDVAGFIPGVGDICDFINAGISLLRGHWLEAGICLLAMIPFCDMIKSLKYSDEAAKLLKYGDEAIDGVKTIAKEGVEKTAKQNSKFLRRGEKADKMFSTIDLGDEFAVTYKNGATDTISKASTTAEGSRCLGNGCFVAGTLVHTEEGIKKIEDIKIGDRVLSFNEETNETSYKEVIDTIERSTYEICTIEHSNGKIQSTTGHLFMVEGKWWNSAIEIEVGDKLVLSNGEVTDVLDVSAEEVSYPIKTYNLSIDEDHTFFVSSDGILTHNTIKVNSCTTKTSYVKSIADLKNTENFKDGALEHILEGEINKRGKAVGFHYEGFPTSKGKIIEGTKSVPDELGIYTGKVEISSIVKTANGGKSTFFPESWTAQDVVDAINEAYNNKQFIQGTRNTYRGKTASGFKIEMYIDNDTKKIISAFPKQ